MALLCGRSEGHYDFAHPGDKSAQLWIHGFPKEAGFSGINETMEIGGEFDMDVDSDTDPMEVADLILKRSENYWISTSKEEIKKRVQWMRDNEKTWRLEWCRSRIKSLDKRIKELQERRVNYFDQIREMREEVLI